MDRTSVAAITALGLWAICLLPASAAAATYTVNTGNDVDDGTCDASHCSLREAIIQAEQNSASDDIVFLQTVGPAPLIIELMSPLPFIT